jgi:Na+/H+ antiporter NhaD/arsenite permease-like protein
MFRGGRVRLSRRPVEDEADRAHESEAERLDRNFSELLQELRVAQTGVQILFAFLLTLPFAARFGGVDTFERVVYVIALMAAAAAAAMIIAPVAYHRMLFRRGQKPQLVRSAHRMASGGLAFLLVSMVCSVLLVMDFLAGRVLGIVLSAAAAVWFILLWGVLPWRRRGDDGDEF